MPQSIELTRTNWSIGLAFIFLARPGSIFYDASNFCFAKIRFHVHVSRARSTNFALAKFSGVYTGEATPDPIPNSEVKLPRADGTMGISPWESRSMPDLI